MHGISPINFTPSHLIRAAVEGVSFGILSGLDLILEGKPAEVIQVIGGGARSRAWRQLLADATGATIHVPAEAESGCLGAAIQAMVAWSKRVGPSPHIRRTRRPHGCHRADRNLRTAAGDARTI